MFKKIAIISLINLIYNCSNAQNIKYYIFDFEYNFVNIQNDSNSCISKIKNLSNTIFKDSLINNLCYWVIKSKDNNFNTDSAVSYLNYYERKKYKSISDSLYFSTPFKSCINSFTVLRYDLNIKNKVFLGHLMEFNNYLAVKQVIYFDNGFIQQICYKDGFFTGCSKKNKKSKISYECKYKDSLNYISYEVYYFNNGKVAKMWDYEKLKCKFYDEAGNFLKEYNINKFGEIIDDNE